MTALLPEVTCYLNGEFSALADAKVSVMDRGFIFGDGIYEMIPVYGGRLFLFDAHMARLQRSLDKVRIHNPKSYEQWLALARELVRSVIRRKTSSSICRSRAVWRRVTT